MSFKNDKKDRNMNEKIKYLFPLLLIVLDIGAAVVYAVNKDFKKAVYWLAAAVLNITVTF